MAVCEDVQELVVQAFMWSGGGFAMQYLQKTGECPGFCHQWYVGTQSKACAALSEGRGCFVKELSHLGCFFSFIASASLACL